MITQRTAVERTDHRGAALPRGSCSQADLLWAYNVGGSAGLAAAATLLGYTLVPNIREEFPPDVMAFATFQGAESDAQLGSVPDTAAMVPFWRLEAFELQEGRGTLDTFPHPKYHGEWGGLPSSPDYTELCPWNDLVQRLRLTFTDRVDGKALDLSALIRRIAGGRILDQIPRRKQRRWGDAIQIIVDRSERLIPFRNDQNRVAGLIRELYARYAADVALWLDDDTEPRSYGLGRVRCHYRMPGPGTLVAVLGDLGCLAGDPKWVAESWENFGSELRKAGCRLVALTPCPSGRWRQDLLPSWTMLAWERGAAMSSANDEDIARNADRLLRLLSPMIRIEPGLLRDIRLLLGSAADGGTEADVWSHRALDGRSSVDNQHQRRRDAPG
jgi:hypothetical protein